MQTDVPDVSGNDINEPSIVGKIIKILKDDIADTIEVVKETEKMVKQ